jgi:hypothetical protein
MYTRNRLDKIKEKKNIINVEHIRKKKAIILYEN